MKKIAVMFGGVSAEHEVSVITGLQVLENIDRVKYEVYPVLQDKTGSFLLFKDIRNRKEFRLKNGKATKFGKDAKGPFIQADGLLAPKIHLDAAYLAFHGGSGESGQVQGLLESFGIPLTSPSCEASVITMNKSLTKEVLNAHGILNLPAVSFSAQAVKDDLGAITNLILQKMGLPVVIKPVHLGSSIGIYIAKTEVELQKNILAAAMMDLEILAEKYLSEFQEYNCAVRKMDGEIQASEIERPLSKDEILSFADKYERGGKKTGGGMASLSRELPAKIPVELKVRIQELAKKVFQLVRAKGMVRIDFMVKDDEVYVTEANPIPGSMAFYLWEASGVSFKDQISDALEQAVKDREEIAGKKLDYKTDIVEKFINSGQ